MRNSFAKNMLLLLAFLVLVQPCLLQAEDAPNNVEEEDLLVPTSDALCIVPPKPVRILCESEGPFLCLNTPNDVVSNVGLLTGRLNPKVGKLSQISLSVQHDYTKELKSYAVIIAREPRCKLKIKGNKAILCINEENDFKLNFPLQELGPHSIAVIATPLAGKPIQKTFHTSFVVKPSVEGVLSFNPSIEEEIPMGTTHLNVLVDFFKDCSGAACDFFGITTHGVTVKVLNTTSQESGRFVECQTNVASGGKFKIGLPVLPGENDFSVEICNAATGDICPKLGPFKFKLADASSVEPEIEIVSPNPKGPVLLSSKVGGVQEIAFKVKGVDLPDKCGDEVKLTFNLEQSKSICPDEHGFYKLSVNPRVGYNFASIIISTQSKKLSDTLAFGWGDPISPFSSSKKDWKAAGGMSLNIPEDFFHEWITPLFNNFIASDNAKDWFNKLVSQVGGGDSQVMGSADDPQADQYFSQRSYCQGELESSLKMSVLVPPKYDAIYIQDFIFSEGSLETVIKLENFRTTLEVVMDANDPESPVLPLKIAFKDLLLNPILKSKKTDRGTVWFLDSRYTDCEYRGARYCKKMPAILVPKRYVGSATKMGAFVRCDVSQAKGRVKDICQGINQLNMQTGQLHKIVLDAVNKIYACQGSNALANASLDEIQIDLPGGLKSGLSWNESTLDADGVKVQLSLSGENNNLEEWPEDIKSRVPGILSEGVGGAGTTLNAQTPHLGVMIPMNLVNQFLFSTKPININLDPRPFKEINENCQRLIDEGTLDLPTLCQLRALQPRVQEIFGSSLTEAGYLDINHPLLMRLESSPLFPLSLRVVDQGIIELNFAQWALSIFALEIDETKPLDPFGNPVLAFENGNPVIKTFGKGPIIKVRVGLTLQAALSPLQSSFENSDELQMKVQVLGDRSKLFFTPIAGTNATLVSPSNLIGPLKVKLNSTLKEVIGRQDQPQLIPIPKSIDLSSLASSDSFLSRFGLERITWGPQGLQLKADPLPNRLEMLVSPVLEQILNIDSKEETFLIP